MRRLLPLMVTCVILSAEGPRAVADLHGGRVRYLCLVGKVPCARFLATASSVLNPERVAVGMVAAYASFDDLQVAGPGQETHCGYDRWRALVEKWNSGTAGCPSVQEAVKIGSTILFRHVDSRCQRGIEVLSGKSNPLDLSTSGTKVEILDLSFSRPLGSKNVNRIAVHLYVRTDEPVSEELARATTTKIKELTQLTDLTVTLRNDVWFLNECRFPAIYPFESRAGLPTKGRFKTTRYASCSAFSAWPTRCFESNSPLEP